MSDNESYGPSKEVITSTEKQMARTILANLIDAAVGVSAFVKHHDYPEIGSEDFQHFTILLNRLEIELKKIGVMK